MNDGNDWIVDIDLEKFFDTVNHTKKRLVYQNLSVLNSVETLMNM